MKTTITLHADNAILSSEKGTRHVTELELQNSVDVKFEQINNSLECEKAMDLLYKIKSNSFLFKLKELMNINERESLIVNINS